MTLAFDVPGTPPNQNRQRGVHWSVIARSNDEWKASTTWSMLEAISKAGGRQALGLPWKEASITATFHFAKATRRDHPNLASSLKPIIDALCPVVLPDDSYVYLRQVTTAVSRKLVPKPYVHIEVTEWPTEQRAGPARS